MTENLSIDIKKINFILPSLKAGGAERVCLSLAKEFLENGIKVDFILLTPSVELEVPEGANVKFLTNKNYNGQWMSAVIALLRIRQLFAVSKPTEIFLASVRGAVFLSLLASILLRTTPRLFIREAALYFPKAWYPKLIHRLMLRMFYPRAKGVIAVSESVRQELIGRFGYKGKVTVINNPVDQIKIKELSLCEIKKSKFHFTYLAVGRLVEEKGFTNLLEAFSKISHDKACGLYVVGAGELESKLRLKTEELQISDQVVWVGYELNPYPWYLVADVFVLSSIKEGFVNVLVEALVLGVPNIVATKCGGGPEELLGEHRYSWLVPPGNVHELSTAMKNARDRGKRLREPELCPELTISNIRNKYLTVFRKNS